MSRPYAAVIGPGSCTQAEARTAYEVGHGLAARGFVLVTGGLGGVMEAACHGARDAHGTTLGILPEADRSAANPHVDLAIPTGMGEMRNALVVRCADVVVAVGGEHGTLSEIAFALKTRVPVVGIDTWDLARGGQDPMHRAADAEEAVALAVGLVHG